MYPEHEKLKAMRERHKAVVDFYDFLAEREIKLCQTHTHTNECDRPRKCGLLDGNNYEICTPPAQLIGDFLGIDPVKLEAEKRAMLEVLRSQNATEGGHPCP